MRRLVDAERIRRFMKALGDEAERETRLYFAGGATAVLMGWRASTVDVDIQMDPESDRLSPSPAVARAAGLPRISGSR
jgi:hypothetical protein